MDITAIILNFSITFVLSMLFGLQRQRSHKPIGFGTYIFVSVGSCGLAITALTLSSSNPLPLLGSIVTGIGFLGAGALIKTTDKIFGFTNAASIWIFAIFGLVMGAGEYVIGIIIYLLVWFVILFDNYLERKGMGSYQKKIIINTNRVIEDRNEPLIEVKKSKLICMDVDKKNDRLSMTYLIEGGKEDINTAIKKLFKKDWFESCRIE